MKVVTQYCRGENLHFFKENSICVYLCILSIHWSLRKTMECVFKNMSFMMFESDESGKYLHLIFIFCSLKAVASSKKNL